MAKKRRRRRKKNHRVYALVTLVLAIAIIVIGFGLLFYVQKIEVSGNDNHRIDAEGYVVIQFGLSAGKISLSEA